MTAGVQPGPPDAWARMAGWPGIRTLRSERFQLLVGATLWLVGLALNGALMLHQAADKRYGEFGIDFADYRTASLRMLDGGSPYAPEMLVGPVPAQGVDRYRYPPSFAQLLTPLAVLPFDVGATVWLALQVVLLFAAVWIAGTAAGAAASVGRFIWTGVALTYFMPVFDALLKGNVNGPLAFAFAVLLATGVSQRRHGRTATDASAGAALGAAIVLKVTPLAVLPAGLSASRRLASWAGAAIAVLVIPSFLLAPQAWRDYSRVFPNLLSGSADFANNLAPAIVMLNLGAPPRVVEFVRAITLGVAFAAMIASVWLARRPHSWAAAVTVGVVAALLLPAAIWYQYLVLLLPPAAFAWVHAGRIGRASLVTSAAAVTLGLASLPLAAAGAAWLGVATVAVLWPRGR